MPNHKAPRRLSAERIPQKKARAKRTVAEAPAKLTSRRETILLLPPSQIEPAPWRSRSACEVDPVLRSSIVGEGHDGLGVLEPVLVRRIGPGRYELIDGERRWRVCLELAARVPAVEALVPARVLDVSEAVAQLIGVTVDLTRLRRTAFEAARGLQRLREALRVERGDAAASARAIASVCPLKKTQVGRHLFVADALTSDVLQLAGLLGDDGAPDLARLGTLSLTDLVKVARIATEGVDHCSAELRALVQAREAGPNVSATAPSSASCAAANDEASTVVERRARWTREGGLSVNLRRPVEVVPPERARALVEEVVPALLALVERAYGGSGREGTYSLVAPEHTLLVVPSEIEALSLAQLTHLLESLGHLHRRARTAVRQRRRAAAAHSNG